MNFIEQVALIAFAAWLIQLGLSYRQAKLFSKRIRSLRQLGRCATGLSGGGYRGRVYVTLVVHPLTHRVLKAEQLRGLTVFASLKPVPQLEGHGLEELLLPDATVEGLPPRVMEATRSAAETLQKSFEQPSTQAPTSV